MEGYLAAISFLIFSGGGTFAQVLKIKSRERLYNQGEIKKDEICDGLSPTREFFSYAAFLTFALSAVTRSYTDYYILLSRLPVIALASIILWQLKVYRGTGNVFYLTIFGNIILLVLALSSIFGLSTYKIAPLMDSSVVLVTVFLFFGKISQAKLMWRDKRFSGVSVLRELGTMIKDSFGLLYCYSVGSDLLWIGITHALSFGTSALIILIKSILQHNQDLSRKFP